MSRFWSNLTLTFDLKLLRAVFIFLEEKIGYNLNQNYGQILTQVYTTTCPS